MVKDNSNQVFFSISDEVLIPSWSVILASSCMGCFLNILLNHLFRSEFIKKAFRYWKSMGKIYKSVNQKVYTMPVEIDPALGNWGPIVWAHGTGYSEVNESYCPSPCAGKVMSVVPASVATEALSDSLHCVRIEAQQMVFVFHPVYMIIATIKSLAMLVALQYHFDQKGGWDRLVVCSTANLMSGLLTPVLEYGARLLLPLEQNRSEKMTIVEPEEPADSVFIVEILVRIGRLELEDLETVLIQGTAFIVFGAVVLPAVVVFCLMGVASFVWVFSPLWLMYVAVRYLYYRHGEANVKPAFRVGGGGGGVLLSPIGEFAKAAFLKVFTLFLLQWTLQSSFLFGLVLLQGGSYRDALRLEVKEQLLGWYNPTELTGFQWLCFVSQLLF